MKEGVLLYYKKIIACLLYKVDIKFLDWEGFLVVLFSVSSDSNKLCLQELKVEGTSDVSHGVAKGLAVGPCHVLCQFLDKHHSARLGSHASSC